MPFIIKVMSRSPDDRRHYFMHPAHPSVGVSGSRPLRRECEDDQERRDEVEEFLARQLQFPGVARIAAVCHPADPLARVSLRQFEQMLRGQPASHGEAWELLGLERQQSNDRPECVVLFCHGLHLARQWSDLGSRAFSLVREVDNSTASVLIEPAATARWHPVLHRVSPFAQAGPVKVVAVLPTDATMLMCVKVDGQERPVAWAMDQAKVFSTTLSGPSIFADENFVRLLENAIGWLRRSR